jgi:hypothetical protein
VTSMVTKKTNPPATKAAPSGSRTTRQDAAPAVPATAAAPDNSQRLLREAAWSRMFGRTESRNPFARSR